MTKNQPEAPAETEPTEAPLVTAETQVMRPVDFDPNLQPDEVELPPEHFPMGYQNIQTDVPNMADLAGIRYVGSADIKILTPDDFAVVGVEGVADELVWFGNGYVVPAASINAAARDWFAQQIDFVVE